MLIKKGKFYVQMDGDKEVKRSRVRFEEEKVKKPRKKPAAKK